MCRCLAHGRGVRGFIILVVLSAGCPLFSGCSNIFGLTPSGHRLTDQAKALRSAYPDP